MHVAIDTETALIEPGNLTPLLTCMSVAGRGTPELFDHRDSPQVFLRLLDSGAHIVGQNIAYDAAVLIKEAYTQRLPELGKRLTSAWFNALDQGRIHDTKIRQQLIDLAAGQLSYQIDSDGNAKKSEFSLSVLALRHLGLTLDKHTYRLRYGELRGIPFSNWDLGARKYATDDAQVTLDVFNKQLNGQFITNETEQTQAAWALHVMSVNGFDVDKDRASKLEYDLIKQVEQTHKILNEFGIYKTKRWTRRNGELAEETSKDLTKIRELIAQSGRIVLTPKNQISTSEEALRLTNIPPLVQLADSLSAEKLLNSFIPVLKRGIINASYNVLLETGRASCFDPNLQQLPRVGGIRECLVPPAGYYLCAVDYRTAELRSLSQVCLDMGIRPVRMAEALRAGRDLHLELGKMLGGNLEDARQDAKVGNFGFPGGMMPETFVEYAAGQGRFMDINQASKLHAYWFQAWPEMHQFFAKIKNFMRGRKLADIEQFRSLRKRGRVRYTAVCNGFFQGLTADGAKSGLYNVCRESYLEELNSPLFGSKPKVFMHDEQIAAVRGTEAADRLAQVMRDSMQPWTPDVPCETDMALMSRWYKKAKEVRAANGELNPWEPKIAS